MPGAPDPAARRHRRRPAVSTPVIAAHASGHDLRRDDPAPGCARWTASRRRPLTDGSYAALPEVRRRARRATPQTVLRRNGAYRAGVSPSNGCQPRRRDPRPPCAARHRRRASRRRACCCRARARALFRGLYEDRGKILLGIAAIFLALLFLTALLSRSIARPVEALSAATRSVAAGRGEVPDVPATAAIEIQDLYRDFAIMAAAIERRSRYLRDFAHAVSHEFKTPLAGIRGALELVADDDMAATDRARFLANADADAERLQHLVTRLLELARADMTRPEGDPADISAVAAAVAGLDAANLPPLPPVALSASALERVLATLVENSRQAGATRVTLTATADDDAVTLRVADDGPGIPDADRARIFEPFFTTRRVEGGSGLGLPIARSLLDTAGGGIELGDTDRGTCFVLTLPISRAAPRSATVPAQSPRAAAQP